ncbi:hypothetical protein NW762_004035 [Fusarium torreyae]|uniref:Uncharacterized protein n=1 Tax=Fusarium torreyae TaxID=1237075 RepID=A0A9W8VHR6_9HYPO|nr:hypothetical protein NW762_004035 [Fusarium torreyae]
MPPVRTAKSNSCADAPALGAETPKKRLLKPVCKGVKDANFRSSQHNWDGHYHHSIGTSTRVISFGNYFVLTDEHIDDIAVLARQFNYTDVSYDAKNDARGVTNEGAIRLAKALPNLKIVELPGTGRISDEGLIGFFKNLPHLRTLEVTGCGRNFISGSDVTGRAFDELRQHPEWVPNLKSLIVKDRQNDKEFVKSVRELGKERGTLMISLVSRHEEKNYGDWDLEESSTHYKKGRKQSEKPKNKRFASPEMDPFLFGKWGGGGYGPWGKW